MRNKKYKLYLDENYIGFTHLEKADAPMGVVFGLIDFEEIESPYNFFIKYCKKNNITINDCDSKFGLIDTQGIEGLKLYDENGTEIVGLKTSISGMTEKGFYIETIGILYPFYEEQFPHHVEEYKKSRASE